MPLQEVVVVGAGAAGLRAVESLRGSGFTGPITVVGAEPDPPYDRPVVSKAALAEPVTAADVALPVKRSAADVTWLLGTPVVTADLAGRVLGLADGSAVTYDGLVVASGLRPLPLDVPGPAGGRHVLRSLADAAALRPLLRPGVRVLVVGAGFVGCEVAVAAATAGCVVDCVALDPVPLLRPLGGALGGAVRRRLEAMGIRFHLGESVAELDGDGGVRTATLSGGGRMPVDVVVAAIGSTCAVSWLPDEVADPVAGVLTDEDLRVLDPAGARVPGVVAVGDVARYPNPRFGAAPRRVEHWTNAADTGRRAGQVLAADLAGAVVPPGGRTWPAIPSFWSDLGEIRLQAFGLPELADPDGMRVVAGELDGDVVVGYHRGDDLVAAVGIGPLDQVLPLRERIGVGRAETG